MNFGHNYSGILISGVEISKLLPGDLFNRQDNSSPSKTASHDIFTKLP